MVVACEQVWREISNYLDGELDPALHAAMEEHYRDCKNCSAVLNGMRNVVQLYGDERMLEVPLGFSHRLHRRLEQNSTPARRTFLGWAVAFAAGVLVAGSFELARSLTSPQTELRSEHADPGSGVPPELMVVVADDGKTFHVPGCRFIHDKARLRTIAAAQAIQEGFVPCVRCMRKYLKA
ncbi:MAG: zf-HC2 domain-containing protein [Acidobacteriaceae bacterium]|nr:zf-HC2 domain-containing protein [Acidobacteriaceae bacterium]